MKTETIKDLLRQLYFEDDKLEAEKLMARIMDIFLELDKLFKTYSEAYDNQVKITQAMMADKHKAMEALLDIAFHEQLNTKKSSLVKVAKDTLAALSKHRETEWLANGLTGVDPVKQK